MSESKNNLNFKDLNLDGQDDSFSIFSGKIYDEVRPSMTFLSSGEEKIFFKEQLINKKRNNNSEQKARKLHTKYTYDNLKRKCKHLVIENVKDYINRKIKEEYNGNIGEGILKKELVKLNQSQKKNSDVEFNKSFIYKTLKEILSQKITTKIKFLDGDHNKRVIEKLIEEKKDKFEKLFNVSFIECVDHFIGNKQIYELNGLTLFSELKEQILNEYKEDGESYYENLKIFLKEFEQRINNAIPRKRHKTKTNKLI